MSGTIDQSGLGSGAPDTPLILVVDDSRTMRLSINLMLQDGGYRVIEAADAAAGLEAVRSEDVALVLSDINMPDASGTIDSQAGFRLLAALQEERPDLPVALFTDADIESYLKLAIEHNVGNILAKPVTSEELLHCIRMWLTREGMFGLEHYLPPGCEILSEHIANLAQLEPLQERMLAQAVRSGFPMKACSKLHLIAEEIMVNAILHAHGFPRDHVITDVELPTDKAVEVHYGGNGELFGIAATDRMGILTKSRVLEVLEAVVSQRNATEASRLRPGGRGVFLSRALSAKYCVNIHRGERTEIIAVADAKDGKAGESQISLRINEV